MRILVTGATGLIGSAVTARLVNDGHVVVGVARNVAGAACWQPRVEWASLDIAKANTPETWLPLIAGAEAVVNCAGVLQDAPGDAVQAVHADGMAALFAACEASGLRRVVHVSAIGVDRATPSEFSRSKLEGDRALSESRLDWVILRPSVVVGASAYGGSAMFRGLACCRSCLSCPTRGRFRLCSLTTLWRPLCICCDRRRPRGWRSISPGPSGSRSPK